MALQLKTADAFLARSDMLARPPLPDDAIGYADFLTGLHITQAAASTADNTGIVINPAAKRQAYVYDRTGQIVQAAAGTWQGVSHSADGEPMGLSVTGAFTQALIADHRSNLSAGTAVGAVAAASGAAAQPWQQWYSVTPSGAGEASLALSTGSTRTGHVYWVIDVRGTGFVQLGLKGAPNVRANFDIATGALAVSGGAVGQAIRRPGGAWSLGIHGPIGSTPIDALPYIASVNSLTAGALGPAGVAFEARAPRVEVVTTASYANTRPWPVPNPDQFRTRDDLTPATTMMAAAADFSVVFSTRANSTRSRLSESFFYLAPAELRFASTNKLVLYSGSVLWTGQTDWVPDRIYNVGFSRRGSLLSWSVNGEIGEADVPAAADTTPYLLRAANNPEMGSGHLRRVIWWADGRSSLALRDMADRWL